MKSFQWNNNLLYEFEPFCPFGPSLPDSPSTPGFPTKNLYLWISLQRWENKYSWRVVPGNPLKPFKPTRPWAPFKPRIPVRPLIPNHRISLITYQFDQRIIWSFICRDVENNEISFLLLLTECNFTHQWFTTKTIIKNYDLQTNQSGKIISRKISQQTKPSKVNDLKYAILKKFFRFYFSAP